MLETSVAITIPDVRFRILLSTVLSYGMARVARVSTRFTVASSIRWVGCSSITSIPVLDERIKDQSNHVLLWSGAIIRIISLATR